MSKPSRGTTPHPDQPDDAHGDAPTSEAPADAATEVIRRADAEDDITGGEPPTQVVRTGRARTTKAQRSTAKPTMPPADDAPQDASAAKPDPKQPKETPSEATPKSDRGNTAEPSGDATTEVIAAAESTDKPAEDAASQKPADTDAPAKAPDDAATEVMPRTSDPDDAQSHDDEPEPDSPGDGDEPTPEAADQDASEGSDAAPIEEVAQESDAPEPEPAAPKAPPNPAFRRLMHAGAPRLNRSNLVVTVLAVALGFALSTQITHTQNEGLESLRASELVGVLDTVSQRSRRLAAELKDLERVRDSLSSGRDGSVLKEAQAQLDTLSILTGASPAAGPGTTITVVDPVRKLTSIHLLDLVQELRDAGAEAIQIGDQRVVASSYFADQDGSTVTVNGVAVSFPLTVLAIGDPHTLTSALSIPGGVVETARQRGASVEARPQEKVTISALAPGIDPKFARPVAEPS